MLLTTNLWPIRALPGSTDLGFNKILRNKNLRARELVQTLRAKKPPIESRKNGPPETKNLQFPGCKAKRTKEGLFKSRIGESRFLHNPGKVVTYKFFTLAKLRQILWHTVFGRSPKTRNKKNSFKEAAKSSNSVHMNPKGGNRLLRIFLARFFRTFLKSVKKLPRTPDPSIRNGSIKEALVTKFAITYTNLQVSFLALSNIRNFVCCLFPVALCGILFNESWIAQATHLWHTRAARVTDLCATCDKPVRHMWRTGVSRNLHNVQTPRGKLWRTGSSQESNKSRI